MRITIPLRSAAEIERLHTAVYSYAETRADGLRPSIVADGGGALLAAHILLPDEQSAQAFRRFWTGYRDRRLSVAA